MVNTKYLNCILCNINIRVSTVWKMLIENVFHLNHWIKYVGYFEFTACAFRENAILDTIN